MSKSEEIRAEQEKAEAAAPVILDGLRSGTEVRSIADRVAARFDLDLRTAYNWVVISEDKFDRSRRRTAGIGIAVLCLGFALVVAGLLLRLFGSVVLDRPVLTGLSAGLPIASLGLILGLASRRIARS